MAKQTFTTGQVLTAAQVTSLQATALGGGATTAKTTSYVLVAADAGTVVQMNAAGATTITVNQSLFAAGDSVQIQNVGSGVLTVTAGTATVSTSATLALKQYDAGTLYFNTTSAAFFFAVDAADSPLTTKGDLYGYSTLDARIPIGTNNQVLTADSAQALGLKWATPTTNGWTTLETITLSGTSVTTSATFSGYKQIVLQLSNGAASVNASIRLRVNAITTNYYGMAQSGGGTALTSTVISNTGGIDLDNNPLQSGTNANVQFTFPNYDVATTSKVCFWNGWSLNVAYFGTAMTSGLTAAMTSITYTTVAATATLSGTLYVYGVK